VTEERLSELLYEDENMRLDDPRVFGRQKKETAEIERRILNRLEPPPVATFENFDNSMRQSLDKPHKCGMRNNTSHADCTHYIGILTDLTRDEVEYDQRYFGADYYGYMQPCFSGNPNDPDDNTYYCGACHYDANTFQCTYKCENLDNFVGNDDLVNICDEFPGCSWFAEDGGDDDDGYCYENLTSASNDVQTYGNSTCNDYGTCNQSFNECMRHWTDGYGCNVMIECWNDPAACDHIEFQPLVDEQDFEQLTGANIKSLYDGIFTLFQYTLKRIDFAYNYLIDLNEPSFKALQLEELNVNSNLFFGSEFSSSKQF